MSDQNVVHWALQQEWRSIARGIDEAERRGTKLNQEIFHTCELLNVLRARKLALEAHAAKSGLPPLEHRQEDTVNECSPAPFAKEDSPF